MPPKIGFICWIMDNSDVPSEEKITEIWTNKKFVDNKYGILNAFI